MILFNLFVVAVILAAYVVLYLVIPTVGVERAIQAAHAVFVVGAVALTANFAHTLWTIWSRRGRRR